MAAADTVPHLCHLYRLEAVERAMEPRRYFAVAVAVVGSIGGIESVVFAIAVVFAAVDVVGLGVGCGCVD